MLGRARSVLQTAIPGVQMLSAASHRFRSPLSCLTHLENSPPLCDDELRLLVSALGFGRAIDVLRLPLPWSLCEQAHRPEVSGLLCLGRVPTVVMHRAATSRSMIRHSVCPGSLLVRTRDAAQGWHVGVPPLQPLPAAASQGPAPSAAEGGGRDRPTDPEHSGEDMSRTVVLLTDGWGAVYSDDS